jgi:foldase protein PrsA
MKKLINLEVKDDDRKAFYEQRKKDLAQIKVSHILVKTKPEAERILKEIKAGGDFAAAAKKESLDPGSKDKGGDIGFITESSSLVPEFKKAAMALKPGELSGVVKSQYGYHIIKATEQKKTYEELKDTIEELMAIQRQAEFLKRLEDQAKIENNL